MTDWRTKETVFEVYENNDVYTMCMTGNEMSNYLKAKIEMNGYISGLGGDKKYSIYAIELKA